MSKKIITVDGATYVRADAEELHHNDPFKLGKTYLIRTVTMILTGRVVAIKNGFLILEDAAWIADTGRFANALKSGKLSEIEPAEGEVFVAVGSIVDVYEWNHPLPREQK